MTVAVPLILGSFAIWAAVMAGIWLFIASQRADSEVSAADRAHDWREQMRKLSHDRQYR